MANDITGAVWRLDSTPFSYPYPGVKIVNANWTDAQNLGDQAVLQTTASHPIIDSKAQGPNYQQHFGFLGWQNGVKLVTLNSGVLNLSVGAGK